MHPPSILATTARRTIADVPALCAAFAVALSCVGAARGQAPALVEAPAADPAAAQATAAEPAAAKVIAGTATAQTSAQLVPSFAELQAAGATIGRIRVVSRQIFDTDDPRENYLLFQWANLLHIQTRPGVIEGSLLFKTGDAVSVRAIEETERLLRHSEYLYDAVFVPVNYRDGVVDIDVLTRDTWSLDLGVSLGRSGGTNSTGLRFKEYNLLGTGSSLAFSRSSDVDRSSDELQFSNDRAFGTWLATDFSHAANSDGGSDSFSIARPFYALDARWAAGVSAGKFNQIDSDYNAGNIVSQYRQWQERAEVYGGLSQGLVDGWVHRYSLGLSARDDRYAVEPGLVPPANLPTAQKLVGPFLRYELIEDHFDRQVNRNQIGRPEFFELGLSAKAQLGLAATRLGSSEDALVYSGTISRGFAPGPGQTLIAAGGISGQFGDGQVQRQQLGLQSQYYRPQSPAWLFYASAAADTLTNPDYNQVLMLGGDSGLRGYPLRYQNGTRRALFTAEERYFSDLYLWRLFRVGAAAFVDAGRAWGGSNTNTGNPGWLSDLGFGLRIISARSAFGNVLHLDLAFPLNTTPQIARVQFLVTTRTSF